MGEVHGDNILHTTSNLLGKGPHLSLEMVSVKLKIGLTTLQSLMNGNESPKAFFIS